MLSVDHGHFVSKALCINSEVSLHAAKGIFGMSFGIGIHKVPPKKGGPTIFWQNGDVVNIVSFDGSVKETGKGMTLHFDMEIHKLVMHVHYSCMLAENTVVSNAIEDA